MAQSHETQTPVETAEEIAQAFDAARNDIRSLTGDLSFHERCFNQKPRLDPYDDMDTPAYWTTFADFVYDTTEQEKAEQGPSLLLDAKQLLAETPRYLFAQTNLDQNSQSLTREERYYAKSVASYYNQLLRNFAYAHPAAQVSDVKQGLLGMVNIAMEDPLIRQSAARFAYATLHGAQHELAFGQILSYTGKQYVTADTQQDLEGIDYIVAVSERQWLGIDVKASDRLVATSAKSTYPFAVRDTNKIVAQSLALDREFHDRFFISDAAARAKAPYLDDMLTKAAKLAA